MATIESLKSSITTMSDSQGLALIIAIRQNRRTPKPKTVAKKKAIAEKNKVESALGGMDQQDMQNLLTLLEESLDE